MDNSIDSDEGYMTPGRYVKHYDGTPPTPPPSFNNQQDSCNDVCGIVILIGIFVAVVCVIGLP